MFSASKVFRSIAIGGLITTISLSSFSADVSDARQKTADAINQQVSAEQKYMADYQQILAEYRKDPNEETLAVLNKKVKDLGEYPKVDDALIRGAQQVYLDGPYDEMAFKALRFMREKATAEEQKEIREQALAILLEHYIVHENVMDAIGYMSQQSWSEQVAIYDRIYRESTHMTVKGKAAMAKLNTLTAEVGKPKDLETREQLAEDAMQTAQLIKADYAEQTAKDFRGNEFLMGDAAEKSMAELKELMTAKKMQNIQLPNLAGKSDELANYQGKYVLIDVWATWCGPCKAGLPGLVVLKEELAGKPFEIISISVDEDVEDVLDYQEGEQPMPWVN